MLAKWKISHLIFDELVSTQKPSNSFPRARFPRIEKITKPARNDVKVSATLKNKIYFIAKSTNILAIFKRKIFFTFTVILPYNNCISVGVLSKTIVRGIGY
jgi:hypothetical protein